MKKGFTLVEIMIVVAIIGLLAAIAIPSFMRARTTSQANACINNLRQIEAGKEQYALETGRTNGWNGWATAFADLVSTNTGAGTIGGYIKQFPICPNFTNQTRNGVNSDLAYTTSPIGENPICDVIGSNGAVKHVLQ